MPNKLGHSLTQATVSRIGYMLILVLISFGVLTACATRSAGDQSTPASVLAPERSASMVQLCATAVRVSPAGGQVDPLFCNNGGINRTAWKVLEKSNPKLMHLGPGTTRSQLLKEFCISKNATVPELGQIYQLVSAYNDWKFGDSASDVFKLEEQSCYRGVRG